MINLIAGKAGSGKTIMIYDALLSKATENNIVITNPQSIESYEMFLAKNNVAATIMSINDAPEAISSILGLSCKKIATTTDKIAIISNIIRTSDNLSIVKSTHFSSGIVDKLLNAITDIKKERITSGNFTDYVNKSGYGGLFGKKISDLSYILDRYTAKLEKEGLIAEEDLLWQVADYMEESGVKICDNLFIDTLPGYLAPTTCFICSLLGAADNIYIAFRTTDSKSHDFFAFSDSMDAMAAVKEYAEVHEFPIKSLRAARKTAKARVRELGAGIDIISENFFDRGSKVKSDDASVRLFEATTSAREVEILCSEIIKLVSEGESFDDILVASPIIEDYFPIIQQMFSDHDIPFHYFKNDVLANTQLFNMIKVLFECCYDEVNLPRIMQIVHLNFLAFTDDEIAVMDSFNKRFGDDMDIALKNCEEFAPESYDAVVDIISRIQENIQYFSEEISGKETAHELLSAIINTLIIYNVNESLYTDVTKLYNGNEYQMCNDVMITWNSLIDVVNSIDRVLGDNTISLKDFADYLEKICKNKKLVNNNKYFGEVRVVSLPDVTNNRPKHLFVLGCNEGNLINLPDETFFTPIEKHNVNRDLNISIPENEYFIGKKIADIYSAFTTPYNTLSLMWASFNNSYNPIERATVIDSIYNIFSSNVVKEDEYLKETGEADFLDLLCKISDYSYSGTEFTDEIKAKIDKYGNHPMFKTRLEAALNNMAIRRNQINAKVPESDSDIELSVTRAERYNECPFKHFVSFNLSPREQKMFEETKANKGTYYHSVFCNFYNYLKDNKVDYGLLIRNKDRFLEIVNAVIDDVQKNHNENALNSSPKLKFVAGKMRETAIVSVWNSLKQIVAGSFRPKQMEYDIGKSSTLSYELSTGQRAIVTGIADRIDTLDINGDKYARIVDYKSGNVAFSQEKADLGIQLQLPMYMQALNDYKFGGMYYFHVHNPYMEDEASSNELKDFKLSGPTLGENAIPEQSDLALNAIGCSVTSEIINVSKTTKSEYGKRSALVTKDEADKMMATAREKYIAAAEGIVSGNSAASPVKTKTYSACTYCPYKSMCS